MVAGGRQPVVEQDNIRIQGEWSRDLDLSIDPDREPDREDVRPAPERSRTGLWMGLGLFAGMGLALVIFGGVGVILLAGAALGGAFVLFVPAVDVVVPEPVVAEPVVIEVPVAIEVPGEPVAPTPAEVAPAAVRKVVPKIAPPVAPPVEEEKVEAELVVMPDPGFRGKPLDKSIEDLKRKGDAGKIGVVAGH